MSRSYISRRTFGGICLLDAAHGDAEEVVQVSIHWESRRAR
jgi:hypothetical protein